MTTTSIVNCRYYCADGREDGDAATNEVKPDKIRPNEIKKGAIQYTNGTISYIGDADKLSDSDHTIDANNKLVIPGLIDCYARLREPGFEKAGTIASETLAAAKSGITTLFCAPDTSPIIDEPGTVELIRRRAAAAIGVNVLPIGALTSGLKGEQLSEMQILSDAGCIAFSNGDKPVMDNQVLRRVMEYSAGFDLNLIIAPQDPWLSGGVAHEGSVSIRLGLPGIPLAAETVALSQLIELCYQTGAKVHFSRLSSQRGLSLVRQAKKDNIAVTADVGIDHLFLTEMDTSDFNTFCHASPPFRTHADKEALRDAIKTGVLDAICSNHAPHELDAKLTPYSDSEPGLSSLDSFTGLLVKLADEMNTGLPTIIDRVTAGPAKCFNLPQGRLSVGAPADLCILDTETYWEFSTDNMISRGKNNPYQGWDFHGSVELTVAGGKTIYNHSHGQSDDHNHTHDRNI